ncbi:hypothetical protein B0H16DRAFT_1352756, partial [Mycena metata]
VMLTRAKRGMVIVTCSSFLRSGDGARTLLGRLARYWETREDEIWIDWRRVACGNKPHQTTNCNGGESRCNPVGYYKRMYTTYILFYSDNDNQCYSLATAICTLQLHSYPQLPS